MATASFHPLEEHPASHAAATYYRERARESAASVPDGAPQKRFIGRSQKDTRSLPPTMNGGSNLSGA
jgi:hypothetical protein